MKLCSFAALLVATTQVAALGLEAEQYYGAPIQLRHQPYSPGYGSRGISSYGAISSYGNSGIGSSYGSSYGNSSVRPGSMMRGRISPSRSMGSSPYRTGQRSINTFNTRPTQSIYSQATGYSSPISGPVYGNSSIGRGPTIGGSYRPGMLSPTTSQYSGISTMGSGPIG